MYLLDMVVQTIYLTFYTVHDLAYYDNYSNKDRCFQEKYDFVYLFQKSPFLPTFPDIEHNVRIIKML